MWQASEQNTHTEKEATGSAEEVGNGKFILPGASEEASDLGSWWNGRCISTWATTAHSDRGCIEVERKSMLRKEDDRKTQER